VRPSDRRRRHPYLRPTIRSPRTRTLRSRTGQLRRIRSLARAPEALRHRRPATACQKLTSTRIPDAMRPLLRPNVIIRALTASRQPSCGSQSRYPAKSRLW
jgi:hypothetical protein